MNKLDVGFFNTCFMKVLPDRERRKSGECVLVELTPEQWDYYNSIEPNLEPVSTPYELSGRKPKRRDLIC